MCPSFLPVAVRKYCDQKQLRGVKGSFGLYFQVTVHWGKSEQELEANTMEKHCLLALSHIHAQVASLYSPGPGNGAVHSWLGPPAPISK